MNQDFDIFGRFEKPTITLCNPDREQLYAMGDIYDIRLTLRYNAMSELSFTIPAKVDGEDIEYFSLLEHPRKVYVEDVGYFIIVDPGRNSEGINQERTITCFSDEYTFATKNIVQFKGTYKFYDLIDPTGTLLHTLIQYVPGWTIGTVNVDLMSKYRTFDLTDTNIYNLLMEEVETKYQCVFEFDTINKTISAVVPTVASATTDIFLSHDNLLSKTSLKPNTDELVTALAVYGAGDLSINSVNPLGTNTIYNFDYFKTTDWMSGSLITAIDNWESAISASQTAYTNYLTDLRTLNEELVTLEGELVDLQSELAALEGVRKVRIEQGLSITAIKTEIDAKEAEITAKQVEITAKEAEIAVVNTNLTTINTAVSFANNFTQDQLDDLQNFVFGNTYQNDAFIQTDEMSSAQIQDMAQRLYDQAQDILVKVSTPRYTLTVDSTNFLFLEEYDEFINQLALGSTITVEIDEDTVLYPALLEIMLSYDNPDNFGLTFSNRLRINDAAFVYSDFFGQTQKAVTTTTFNSEIWSNWEDNYKNDVSTFITSALDASLNNIISSTNQEIKISELGLRAKRYLPETETYSPQQLWMTSNLLVFTADNWATASLALGAIEVNGNTVYGIVADAIVGRLIVGNNLTIQNDNNTFIVDNDGVRIYDAIIDITTTNGNNRIRIDPDNGFKIQKLVGGSWTDKFYANANGDITFSGALSGATGDFTGRITANEGYIGGLTINAQGIQKDANNFIRSNGDLKWGALSIIGTTAIFNGNFYANNLLGLVQSYQIGSVNADTITTGTLTAIDIYGSNIYWSGVWMGTDGTGNSAIAADNKIYITQGYRAVLLMDSDRTRLFHPDEVTIGWTSPTGNIRLNGTILTKDVNSASGYGISESFLVNTPTGNKKMNFINGLLTIEVPQGSLPPITGEDTFFVETGFTVVIPTTAGKVADIELPFDFVLDSVRLVASKPDVIGDAEIDISLKPFATWNLASEASIVGSSPVAIVNGKKYEDTVLDGWTTSFSKGDYLTIDLVSSNTFTQLELSIKGRK